VFVIAEGYNLSALVGMTISKGFAGKGASFQVTRKAGLELTLLSFVSLVRTQACEVITITAVQ
jgi:hypothetical protein